MFDKVYGKTNNKSMLISAVIGMVVFVSYGVYEFIKIKEINWGVVAASILFVANVVYYLVNYLYYSKKENEGNSLYTKRVIEAIDHERLEYDWETVFIKIPKMDFIKSERRILFREAITIFVILFVAIIACVIPIFTDIYPVYAAIVVALLCIIGFIPEHITNLYQSGIGYTRYIPNNIEIHYNKMNIDDEYYDKNNVEQILLSSPSVENSRMRYNELIILSGKKKKRYKFNNRLNKVDSNAFCYDNFFEHVIKWGIRNNINIKLEIL